MISAGPSLLRLAEFRNGYPYKPEQLQDAGMPVIRIRHLIEPGVKPERAEPPTGAIYIDDGDLVFSWSATLAVRRWDRGRALLNQHLYRVDPHPGVDRGWLRYVLEVAVERLRPLMHGSAMTHLTQDMLRMVTIQVPRPRVQRAIADYLDAETARIDALIEKKQRMAELLAQRPALMSEALLIPGSTMYPALPLKYLVSERDERLDGREPLPLLSVSIHSGVVPREDLTDRLPRAEDLSKYKICRSGDIVLNRMRAFQGGVGVALQDGVVSPDYTVMSVSTPLRAAYVHFLMRSPWFIGEMVSRLRGIGGVDQGNVRTPRVGFDDLGLIRVPVPSLDVQDALLGRLDSAAQVTRRAFSLLSQQVALLREHRRTLITAAVTGELDVPGVAA